MSQSYMPLNPSQFSFERPRRWDWNFDVADALHKRLKTLWAWGEATTSREYLLSSLSGRDMARPFFCFTLLANYAGNFAIGETDLPWKLFSADVKVWSYVDYLSVFLLWAMWKTPIHSLRFDFLICISFSLYYALFGILQGVSADDPLLFQTQCYSLHLVTVISGLHPIAQVLTLLILGIYLFWANQASDAVTFISTGLLITWMNGIQTHRSAVTLLQLQQQVTATEQLLDHATDGFCKVTRSAGHILDASSKLESTFDVTNGFQSHTLNDFLPNASDREVLQETIADCNKVSPILVTCRTQTAAEFDARLIPFVSSEDDISICVQVLGEKRFLEGAERVLDGMVDGTRADEEKSQGDGTELMDLPSCIGGQSSVHPATLDSLCYSMSSGAVSHLPGNPVHADLERQVSAADDAKSAVSASVETRDQHDQGVHRHDTSSVPLQGHQPSVDPGTAVHANVEKQVEAGKADEQVNVADEAKSATESSCSESADFQKQHVQDSHQHDRNSHQHRTSKVPSQAKRPPVAPGTIDNLASELAKKPRGKKKRSRAMNWVTLNVGVVRLQQFAETPESTLELMIENLLSGCNIRAIGCCNWHIGLEALRQASKSFAEKPCRKEFTPNSLWQCQWCLTINDVDGIAPDDSDAEDSVVCYICGEPGGECNEGLTSQKDVSIPQSSSDQKANAENATSEDSEAPSA